MRYCIFLILFFSSLSLANIPYVNWENHPIHALDSSPDKTRLAVAHTADNRVQLFDISQGFPVKLGHVKVGLDPVSVRFRTNDELWVVNHISDSITVIDFASRRVITTLQTHDEPFDVVFANDQAFVSCSQVNQVLIFNLLSLNDQPQVIDVVAEDPRAMAVNQEGTKVYVASFESGNKTTVLAGGIDEQNGTLGFPGNPVNRESSPYSGVNPPPNDGNDFFPAFNNNLPEPPKVSMIVRQQEDGRWLDDNGEDWTHLISGEQANQSGRLVGWKLLDHDITVIDTQTHEVSYIGGLMNIGMALSFNAAQHEVSLVGTDAINEVRYEPNLNGIFVRAKIATVKENNTGAPFVVDLNPHLDYVSSTISQSERNKSIGNPRGIVWSQDGTRGYVSGMGSNNVIIIDNELQRVGRIEVGEGATGLVLDENLNRLYVWNHFEVSLSTIDLGTNEVVQNTQLFNPLPDAIKAGRKFLYSSHETSGLGQAACASCHVDARMDKLAWDLGDPSGEMKTFNQNCQTSLFANALSDCENYHPMKGPMMTQTFQDIIGHEPFHWRGDRNGIEEFNGAFQSINGDDEQLSAAEMAQFKSMLATITFPPNPFRNSDNSLPEEIILKDHYTSGRFADAGLPLGTGNPQNGLQLFNSRLLDSVFQCGSCHTIPTGMAVNGSLKLGTINASVGGEIMPLDEFSNNHLGIVSVDGSTQKSIKTPQLRNLYEKVGFEMSRPESLSGFGFLHDGAIDSVARFISAPTFSVRSDQEVADVVALMMAFSGSELENGNIPLGNTPDLSKDTHAGVGKQITITQATQVNSDIDDLVAIASSGKVDLVVYEKQNNYLYDTDNSTFITDTDNQITSVGLMALADIANPITFTLVPKGLGQRLAFDRDGDGIGDRQEIINGSDPTDENSVQVKPKSGLWFNPNRSGHGLDVEFLGENMFVVWYTYNDDGTPTWYLASAPYSENWQADLASYSWDFNTRTATKTVVGTVSLTIEDAKNTQFSWNLRGRESSEEFSFFKTSNSLTAKQFTGTYYDTSDSGWGLSVNTQGDNQVAVIYYYDENGQPRWALGNGANEINTSLDMYSYIGFCPDCSYISPTKTLVGSVQLGFNQNRTLSFTTSLLYPENSNSSWEIDSIEMNALSSKIFEAEVQ